MSATGHLKMHQDHVAWQEELRSWHEDLQAWQSEIAQVKASMPALDKAIDDHANVMVERLRMLAEAGKHIGTHEGALADYEKGETAQRLIGMAGEHTVQAARQEQERDAHQALAHRHREMLAHWRRLTKALLSSGA